MKLNVRSDSKKKFLGFVCLLLAYFSWNLSSPVAAGPDEGYHLATIWCANGERLGVCEIDENGNKIVPSGVYSWCYQHDPAVSASCLDKQELSGFTNASRIGPPTLWSKFLSNFAGTPVQSHVLFMRFLISALVLFIGFLGWKILDSRHRKALALGSLLLFIPNSLYLLTSMHPSGISIYFTLFLGLGSHQLLQTKILNSKQRIDFKLLIFTGISFLGFISARKEAILFYLIFLFIEGLNYLLQAKIIKPIQATYLVSFSIFSVWVLNALQTFFKVQLLPLTLHIWSGPPVDRADWSLLFTNMTNFPSLILGNFGMWGLGALDTPMPMIIWFLVGLVLFAYIMVALVNEKFANVISFVIQVVLFLVLMIAILQSSNLYVGEEMQPRYLTPLLVLTVLPVIVNSNLKVRDLKTRKLLKYSGIILLSLANSLSLWTILRRYTSGLDVPELDLDYNREWWWKALSSDSALSISPNIIWAAGSLSFLCAYLLILNSTEKIQTQ